MKPGSKLWANTGWKWNSPSEKRLFYRYYLHFSSGERNCITHTAQIKLCVLWHCYWISEEKDRKIGWRNCWRNTKAWWSYNTFAIDLQQLYRVWNHSYALIYLVQLFIDEKLTNLFFPIKLAKLTFPMSWSLEGHLSHTGCVFTQLNYWSVKWSSAA